MADWYYIGHYGQLGPLTRDQVDELIDGGVIESDTYVWRSGMQDWLPAAETPELRSFYQAAAANKPPPMPGQPRTPAAKAVSPPPFGIQTKPVPTTDLFPNPYAASYHPTYATVPSDRSRLAGGLLQLIIPGVGRMYLGYAAYGVLQLVLTACLGIGWIWSVIDGILILAGTLKLDGYGRQLSD